jgi:hypothetical protein
MSGYTTTKNAIARFYSSDLKSFSEIGPGMENTRIQVSQIKEILKTKGGLRVEFYGKYRGTGHFIYANGQTEDVNLKDSRRTKDKIIYNIPDNIEQIRIHK